jgi:hypothetical protein
MAPVGSRRDDGVPGLTCAKLRPGAWSAGMTETRKLAAILAADIVGYGPLAGADEERRSSPCRGPLPPNKGDHAHPTDLPFLRRRPSAGMSSAPSWRSRCRSISTTSPAKPASRRNGRSCCAVSTACNRCAATTEPPTGSCAPTPRQTWPGFSNAPMSPCRPALARSVHRRHSRPNPPENAAAAKA